MFCLALTARGKRGKKKIVIEVVSGDSWRLWKFSCNYSTKCAVHMMVGRLSDGCGFEEKQVVKWFECFPGNRKQIWASRRRGITAGIFRRKYRTGKLVAIIKYLLESTQFFCSLFRETKHLGFTNCILSVFPNGLSVTVFQSLYLPANYVVTC